MAAARTTLLAALVSVQLVTVEAAVAADEVLALPGWDGALPSRHFSGYVDVSADGGTLPLSAPLLLACAQL